MTSPSLLLLKRFRQDERAGCSRARAAHTHCFHVYAAAGDIPHAILPMPASLPTPVPCEIPRLRGHPQH